jgi:hypothetical protein
VILDWKVDRHVTVRTSADHFLAGSFLKDTGLRKDVSFFSALVQYRF